MAGSFFVVGAVLACCKMLSSSRGLYILDDSSIENCGGGGGVGPGMCIVGESGDLWDEARNCGMPGDL